MTTDREEPAALADVEFPSHRDECIAAVNAARTYIHDTVGATKAELLGELVPEENYPLGHNAAAVGAKFGDDAYRRKWWEDVVEPGLRAVPDVEAPADPDGEWRPVDGNEH